MWENINCGDFINCGRLSSLLWVVLNAICLGQVEVRFGRVLSWQDVQPNKQGNSADGPWKAEMSNSGQDLTRNFCQDYEAEFLARFETEV